MSKRRVRKKFVWKYKHYYLIGVVGFLLVFVFRVLSLSVGFVDLLYLSCFMLLHWLSFRFIYSVRNDEVLSDVKACAYRK